MPVTLGEEGVGGEAQQPGEAQGEPIRKADRLVMNHRLRDRLLGQGSWVGRENLVDHNLPLLGSSRSGSTARLTEKTMQACFPTPWVGNVCQGRLFRKPGSCGVAQEPHLLAQTRPQN